MLDGGPGSAKDHIGYHDLTQAALRAVVRAALVKAAKLGHLPGDHHYYITFRTRLQGVQMSDDLKDKFPDEMTIVLQHQYEQFRVHADSFEVVLRFGGQQQHLKIPLGAITRFVDPSVNMGLQFDTDSRLADGDAVLDLATSGPDEARPAGEPAEGTVVSLDAFRRK
jgi:hypothetical protein